MQFANRCKTVDTEGLTTSEPEAVATGPNIQDNPWAVILVIGNRDRYFQKQMFGQSLPLRVLIPQPILA